MLKNDAIKPKMAFDNSLIVILEVAYCKTLRIINWMTAVTHYSDISCKMFRKEMSMLNNHLRTLLEKEVEICCAK